MILAFVFIIGLVIGSFLNVCIYRIPREESIAFPPSHCTSCNAKIKPYDLIPVISYIFLKGKCRSCKEKISIIYPAIELLNGALYAAVYLKYGLTYNFFKFIFLISIFIIIGIIDLKTTDVYSSVIYTGIIGGIIFLAVGVFLKYSIWNFLIGAAIGGGIIGLIILLTHGMGAGDAEICGIAGLFLGTKGAIAMLLISFVVGGILGILLIVTGKKSRKDYIPFGPFIVIATLIVIFFGNEIINWYLSLF